MLAEPDPLNAFVLRPEKPFATRISGPMAGLRLAVGDVFDVAGFPTACGSPAKLAEAGPAERNADLVEALMNGGARFVGKTQTDELNLPGMGQNAHYAWPLNPAAPVRVTGGSSSGSAAAVAGRLADVALATDAGGSLRAPASYCGLIGLRPTHARLSLDGVTPLAPSFDAAGWYAADIEIYESVAKLLMGRDPHKAPLSRAVSVDVIDALLGGAAEAAEYERMLGFIDLPTYRARGRPFTSSPQELYWCFRQLQASEAWSIHGPWIRDGERKLGPGVEERFGFGAAIDTRTVHAERVRRLTFRAELADLLADEAVLVLPTVAGAAPYKSAEADELKAHRERALHLLCLADLSGFPQITLPLGTVETAPFGLSLIGPPGSDIALVRLGRRILTNAGKA